jgi:hypothetical protein
MSLMDRIDALLPRWMLTDPRKATGKLMAGFAGLLDAFTEAAAQASLAAQPGQVRLPGVPQLGGYDSVDALPMIARDRRVVEGLGMQPWELAAACRGWLDDAFAETGPFGLLDALAVILVPNVPLLRLVTSNGTLTSWYTRETDGTRRLQRSDGVGSFLQPDGTAGTDTTMAQAWDWDSTTMPPPGDQGDRSGFFLVIYTTIPYFTADDGTDIDLGLAGDFYNDPTTQLDSTTQGIVRSPWAGTCGTNAPWEFTERIRATADHRRAGGAVCRWIVAALDPTSFNPDGTSGAPPAGSAYPDGTWGQSTKYDATSKTRILSRNSTAEYWAGRPGAVAL